jgi:hypothetical protein
MPRSVLILIAAGWVALLVIGLVFIEPVYQALEPLVPHGLRKTATNRTPQPAGTNPAGQAVQTNAGTATNLPFFLSQVIRPRKPGNLMVAAAWAPLRETPERRGRELGAAFHGELLPLLATNIVSNHYKTLAGKQPAFVPADSVEPVGGEQAAAGLVPAANLPGGTDAAAVARETWRALMRADREKLARFVLDRLSVHLILAEQRITLERDDLLFLPDGERLGGNQYDHPVRLGTLFALARRIPTPTGTIRTNEPWPAEGPLRLVIVKRGTRFFLSALLVTESPRPD